MSALPLDYVGLKDLSAETKRPVGTLLALSPQNDPFYAGAPARRAGAEWIAALWADLGVGKGHHLRRIHYRLVSAASPIAMLNGKSYENTDRCWQTLCSAASDARHLGLVPIDALVDRRNGDPLINLGGSDKEAWAGVLYRDPSFDVDLVMPKLPELYLSSPEIAQPYHVELWCEKTTINDILERLAQRYGLNVVTGAGELSITACVNVVDRARASGRPVRILYISDFDPAGLSMPVAVARKVEHRLRCEGLDLDIQLRPVVLTEEQCRKYGLPRTPIKETERRATAFEARFGEGATELDALEALHPGTLREILQGEIDRYYDQNLRARVWAAAEEAESHIRAVSESVLELHRPAIAEVEREWQAIVDGIEAWQARAKPVWQAIATNLEAEAPDPRTIEWPEANDGAEDPDPLFDSTRSYLEQIDRYKRHQGKPTARRQRKADQMDGGEA